LRTKFINRYMKVNIYLNEKLYKTVDLGNTEGYDPKQFTDLILADKKAGTIPASFKINEGISIRIEKV
jgi:hypothetical protein